MLNIRASAVLRLFLFSCSPSDERCVPVPNVAHARHDSVNALPGSVVTYTCDLGYSFSSGVTATITCTIGALKAEVPVAVRAVARVTVGLERAALTRSDENRPLQLPPHLHRQQKKKNRVAASRWQTIRARHQILRNRRRFKTQKMLPPIRRQRPVTAKVLQTTL